MNLICADCGKEAALKPKSHYFYDYIVRLKETNKQLLEACEACIKVIDIKHILSSCPSKDCIICGVVESMKAAIAEAEGNK